MCLGPEAEGVNEGPEWPGARRTRGVTIASHSSYAALRYAAAALGRAGERVPRAKGASLFTTRGDDDFGPRRRARRFRVHY